MVSESSPGDRARLAAIYKGTIVPTVEPSSIGTDGLPHSIEGVLRTVERNWLGAEGATLIGRHIEDGVLSLERPEIKLAVKAQTLKDVPCPIVWGISVEGGAERDDIVEPHLLVPEGEEVIITISGQIKRKLALLGIYDEESAQAGMPPIRKPLHEENQSVDMYVGDRMGNVPVVFWKNHDWGYLRVTTAVKSVSGDLTTIEDGAPDVALHGGLYLIAIPEIPPPPTPEINVLFRSMGNMKGGTFRGGMPEGNGIFGGELFSQSFGGSRGLFLEDRAGGLTQGELRGRGGTTDFDPDISKIIPFILRIRSTGEVPSYLNPANVAINTKPTITVKTAICAHCGVNAPKESYRWFGNEFRAEKFDCGRCGGGTLEPVMYRRRIPRK